MLNSVNGYGFGIGTLILFACSFWEPRIFQALISMLILYGLLLYAQQAEITEQILKRMLEEIEANREA